MNTPRKQMIELIEQGVIPAEKIKEALVVGKVTPEGKKWLTFIDHLLLWLGALAIAFSVMFFVAYNWEDMGRFAKFGMVETVIVLAIAAYYRFADNTLISKISLVVASICLGVLLALFGQTYQTGADTWQLFFYWALLMLPWAVIGRFSALWIIWVALINLSILLYFQTFRGRFDFIFGYETSALWAVFIFNTVVFVAWQLLMATYHWLSEPWSVRLLAVGSGAPLTWLVLVSIFGEYDTTSLSVLVWAFWLASMVYVYRKVKVDLFMLAGCCLSTTMITVTLFGKTLLSDGKAGGFLTIVLILIAMGGGSALWLKQVHREIDHE
jgi:uncharacterized membrane protein